MKKKKSLLSLFLQFLKFGCFTFGGGWSIVSQMQRQYVEKENYISNEEIVDMISVGKSLPGAMICNVAMLFGNFAAGPLGGIVCILGMALAPLAIICVVTLGYTAFINNHWIAAAMRGIRTAVVPIILSAALTLSKSAFRLPPCYIVFAVSFILYVFFGVSCIWLVVIGLFSGIFICEVYERRRKNDRPA